MKIFLYPIAAIFIALWAIGNFSLGWPAGVHVLLVVALMAIVLRSSLPKSRNTPTNF